VLIIVFRYSELYMRSEKTWQRHSDVFSSDDIYFYYHGE